MKKIQSSGSGPDRYCLQVSDGLYILPALHAGHTDERQGPQWGAVQVDCGRGREIHCQHHPPEEVGN